MKRSILLASAIFLLQITSTAQPHGLPPEVYYLLPEFGKGMVYFSDHAPAVGVLNICALDNSLRFKDEKGKELQAENEDNVVKVQIDTAFFLHCEGAYYRMYPITSDIGIAIRRHVTIRSDIKDGAYGIKTQTSSTKEYNLVYMSGVPYKLGTEDKEYPFSVSETICLYKDRKVYLLKKNTLRKLFPAHKEEVDAFYKEGGKVPGTVEGVKELVSRWIH